MEQCEFCGAALPSYATFCGRCGHPSSRASQRITSPGNVPTLPLVGSLTLEERTALQPDHIPTSPLADTPLPPSNLSSPRATSRPPETPLPRNRPPLTGNMPRPVTLVPFQNEETLPDKEEEKPQRAILMEAGVPLIEQLANLPSSAPPPALPAEPSFAHSPALPSAPQFPASPPAFSGNAPQFAHSPALPSHAPAGSAAFQQTPPASVQPIHAAPPVQAPVHGLPTARPYHGHAGPQQQQTVRRARRGFRWPRPRRFPGWVPIMGAFLAVTMAILATTVTLGATVFAPGLALSGAANVSPGGHLTIRGHNFFPNSSVTLTLDNTIAIFLAEQQAPGQTAARLSPLMGKSGLALSAFQALALHNTISSGGNGTFTVTIPVNPAWAAGPHTIHATEAISHRSASLKFTIARTVTAATPAPTATPTATAEPAPTATPTAVPQAPAPTQQPVPTPRPTATHTPTKQPPALSCANPASLALGPVSELTSQLASAAETLCTSGSGALTWHASWNQTQAPWLQMAQTTGSIQAPAQGQVTISASAAQLHSGTYTTTVTFSSTGSTTTRAVNITLTVASGCVKAAPQSLSFTGSANTSNPDDQSVTITNCNLKSNWSAAIAHNSNWLKISASNGTLNAGATDTLTVTASVISAELDQGQYQDTLVFTIGTATARVDVTLTVQAAPTPTISVNVNSLSSGSNCSNDESGNSVCSVTLINNSRTAALTWSWSASEGSETDVTFASATIPPGGTEDVTIIVPLSNCGSQVAITFTALDSNSVSVFWTCSSSEG